MGGVKGTTHGMVRKGSKRKNDEWHGIAWVEEWMDGWMEATRGIRMFKWLLPPRLIVPKA